MAYKVKLSVSQRDSLINIVRTGKKQAKIIMHANILLLADCSPNGPSLKAKVIAENLHVHEKTVHRVRRKFVEQGLEAALQRKEHKQYKPRKLDGEAEAQLIALCCSKAPNGRVSWTLQLLADELVRLEIVESISKNTVREH